MSTPAEQLSSSELVILEAVKQFPWDLPTSGPNNAVAYEGYAFTPPDSKPWAFITLLPVSLDSQLQTVDKDRQILQVDLYGPMNQGTRDLYKRRDAVLAYFAPRRLFTFQGQAAKVMSRARSNWRTYGGYQSIALSIRFVAAVPRPFS